MTAAAPEAPPNATDARPAVACDHCGLAVPPALVDAQADAQFCCTGCRVAYDIIRGCGLDEYYDVRDRLAEGRRPAGGDGGERYAAYDSQVFQDKHTTRLTDGLVAIDLYLEGVHCAACVWLVERLPRMVPGVIEARLSLASSSARVVWDPRQCALSSIAVTLDRLGYAPHPVRDASAGAGRAAGERARLIQMAVAGALAGNNMLIALALYAGVFDGIEPRFATLFRWVTLAIGWVSLAWPGRVFFRSAWSAVAARTINLDVPISLAIGVGAVAGTANVLLNRGDVYFDSLSVLVFLLLVGRFIQARQQRWAQEAVGRMLSLTPSSCRVLRGGALKYEPIEALAVGDVVEVRAGELLPADGEVCRGESSVDRSVLTGESTPHPVAVGDAVNAGAQNIDATLRVRVTAAGESTRIGRLMRLVEQGLREKPATVQFTDRVAGWFVVVVAALAWVNFAAWAVLRGVPPAIDTTVALLIVACPCALGLATPLTMAIAIGRASRQGVLVKTAGVLETLGRVGERAPGRLLLDKTGTLTKGELRVVAWRGDAGLQPVAARVEAESNHPVAHAIKKAFPPLDESAAGASAAALRDRVEHHGKGISAACRLGEVAIGSPSWITQQGHAIDRDLRDAIDAAEQKGQTAVAVALNRRVRAIVCLEDEVRQDAAGSLAALERRGWSSAILSGDARGPVAAVARRLGIERRDTHVGLSPEDKLKHVWDAKSRADARPAAAEPAALVMVGDGVNDAAALAAADVGIAVHGGAEAALAAADVYVAVPGLAPVVDLIGLARRTVRVVRQNLAISLAYNTLAVSLAAAGVITPLVAAVLMPISSATVLAGAVYGLLGRSLRIADAGANRGS